MEVLLGLSCDDGDSCTTNEHCQEDGVCAVTEDGGINGTALCEFDESKVGKNVGDHVKNFAMKTGEGCPYWLHQSCGTEKKVIWMLLATGWDGAGEGYAGQVEQIYQENKDKGLEVLWVFGEDEEKSAPSLEWVKQWKSNKEVSFTVLRDSNFYQAYGSVNNSGISALPHQYVIDATNMELLYATGGVHPELEEFIFDLLDAETGEETGEPPTSGCQQLTTTGVQSNNVKVIDYSGQASSAKIGHRIDNDSNQDGCISELELTVGYPLNGCEFTLAFEVVPGTEWLKLVDASLNADFSCPGWNPGSHGLYNYNGQGEIALSFPENVLAPQAFEACFAAELSLSGEIAMQTNGGKQIAVGLNGFKVSGTFVSHGDLGLQCPSFPGCNLTNCQSNIDCQLCDDAQVLCNEGLCVTKPECSLVRCGLCAVSLRVLDRRCNAQHHFCGSNDFRNVRDRSALRRDGPSCAGCREWLGLEFYGWGPVDERSL
jgi:hypothetical protein